MIVVIGAGAYGTALAVHWAHHQKDVALLTYSVEQACTLLKDHENVKRLAGIPLTGVIVTGDKSIIKKANIVVFTLPAQMYRSYCKELDFSFLGQIVIGSKGLDQATGGFLSDVIKDYTQKDIAIWSGPQFAHELARDLPSAVTLACSNLSIAQSLQARLTTPSLKIYPSTDVLAAELCGALKNVIAIACGIAKGRELGENAIAAIITRGLAEMRRLGKNLGAHDESFFELACIGDLMLTCTSLTSRNCSFGYHLGKNIKIDSSILIEGCHTVKAAFNLSQKHQVYMPITAALHDIIYNKKDVDICISQLLSGVYAYSFKKDTPHS